MDSNEQHLDDFSVKGLLDNLRVWISFLFHKKKIYLNYRSYF